RAAAARRADRTLPEPVEEAAAAAPAPRTAAQAAAPAAPQPAAGTRWPSEQPSGAADAQPQDRVAAAGIAVLPERLAPPPGPREGVGRGPGARTPPQPATVRLAAAPPVAPPAAAETSGAVPAALFGIALLLAVFGIMLVRARRRFIVRVTDALALDGLASG